MSPIWINEDGQRAPHGTGRLRRWQLLPWTRAWAHPEPPHGRVARSGMRGNPKWGQL